MLKRKKTEHIRGGVKRLKPLKYQFIANLEQENFIFRKMFCNFASGKLQSTIRKQFSMLQQTDFQIIKKYNQAKNDRL